MKTNRFLSAAIFIAITFTNSYAYTAEDVYGAWTPSGKLETKMSLAMLLTGFPEVLPFDNSGLANSSWNFNAGVITFLRSKMYCQLQSAKAMVCYIGKDRLTYYKAGTVSQYAKVREQEERDIAKRRKIEEENERLSKLPFYKDIEIAKFKLKQIYDEHKNVEKGEFESTADFNKRKAELDKNLKDSTESYFYNAFILTIDNIRDNRAFDFNLVKYDADKHIYEVAFKRDGLEIKGKVKMSSEIAQKIKGDMKLFSFAYDDVDLKNVDYILVPAKMAIYDTDKNEYAVTLDIPKNAKEIAFKGSELWKDNTYAKNISVNWKEAIQRNDVLRKEREVENAELAKEGLMMDFREGKRYKFTAIGSQVWMAENLNYNAKGSKCYKDEPENCEKYGRLYYWETALEACPRGWHLPSNEEWQTLVDFAGGDKVAGTKLKAKSGWEDYEDYNSGKEKSGNGTDDYGFSALPGGYGIISSGHFTNVGNEGLWWSSTSRNNTAAQTREINLYDRVVNRGMDYNKSRELFSVRCLRD